VFIVLAEPGAGKTELLGQLAVLLNVMPIRASIFRSRQSRGLTDALVIDAMDEVARIDLLAMNDIVVKASEATTAKVVFAGRSSEWDISRTEHVKEVFGTDPVVVQLQPFNEAEQRQLFEAKFPGEHFDAFVEEARRLELVPLFGNPQFLQLFGEAYIESGRVFTSKAKIFSDAVRRLAHEANKLVPQTGRPPLEKIIALAGEVFAKLMLSGASGVSTIEELDNRNYPYLASLAPHDARYLTDTRLFRPGTKSGNHEPVHRIVAEYCAACYLAARIESSSDRLSLARVLSVIAPSGVVRTELRGMLGWIAAVSHEPTQLKLIEIDPYAVFASGDPSQLTARAKKYLVRCLDETAREDPYFRRSDVWRRFNVGRFFTEDIYAEVAAILAPDFSNPSLRALVLELLPSSGSIAQFATELRSLALHGKAAGETRQAAYSALLAFASYDPRADFKILLAEGTRASLELAAKAIRVAGMTKIDRDDVVELLRQLASLYPKRANIRDPESGSRYFIKQLIRELDLPTVVVALDELTCGLLCTCHPKLESLCECRTGISKILGSLLDRYFADAMGPHDPVRIWAWIKPLHFENYKSSDRSAAIEALRESDGLRREVQRLAVANQLNAADVESAVSNLFLSSTHAGVRFQADDMGALADHAFEVGDVVLWGALWIQHNIHGEQRRTNPQRTLQRSHAKRNPDFMREWARREHAIRQLANNRHFLGFRRRRFKQRQAELEAKNRAYLLANRTKIEAGEHWFWLWHFTQLYLFEPEKLGENLDYGDTPLNALRNCIPFLSPHVPTLQDLAAQKGTAIAQTLLAHCIVRLRDGKQLDELAPVVLKAAATEVASYPTLGDGGEMEALSAEFDRLVFLQPDGIEEFASQFIEPALTSTENVPTNIEWLENRPAFRPLRTTLPMEWLEKYPSMPYQAMRRLFEMAAKYGNRDPLIELVDRRFADPVPNSGLGSNEDQAAALRHQFWAQNAFFFGTPRSADAWNELSQDPLSLLAIQDRIGMFSHDGDASIPPLSAEAIFRILDAFAPVWPKVPLPSSHGTSSPKEERAYRFLKQIAWRIGNDVPTRKLPVLDRLLVDGRFNDFGEALLSLRAETLRQLALQDYLAPSPTEVSALLDRNEVASVEDLRALLVEELEGLQEWLKGAETNPLDTFYDGGSHVDENTGRNRVVDFLNGRMKALGLSVVIEHHMADGNRCDFTAAATIAGSRALLVVEVKGQWHPQLFTAASAQLNARYAIHPDAAGQGIYLVFWFGRDETIAGKVDQLIATPQKLRAAILAAMPDELKCAIDVVVLDVSWPVAKAKKAKKAKSRMAAASAAPKGTLKTHKTSAKTEPTLATKDKRSDGGR